jgi:hypothetical protein
MEFSRKANENKPNWRPPSKSLEEVVDRMEQEKQEKIEKNIKWLEKNKIHLHL